MGVGGGQSVTIFGPSRTLRWPVDSWDSLEPSTPLLPHGSDRGPVPSGWTKFHALVSCTNKPNY